MRAYLLTRHIFVLFAMGLASPVATSQAVSSGLKSAVEAAWERSPHGRTLEARREEVLAGREAAQSWVAGSPSVGVSQRTDRWTNRLGVRETDVSLSAPIWLPGQKSARGALAVSNAEDLEAQITNARLTLAGEVRERLWAVAAAREELTQVRDHTQHLQGLADEVTRRVTAGDLARTDSLLAQQEVLAAQAAIVMAQVKLEEARARYKTLTGQVEIPEPEPEVIAELNESHPRLRAARSSLNRTLSAHTVVSASRSDPPTVGILLRREQGTSAGSSNSSVGIAVQVPIGTSARNRPLETAALTQVQSAAAEVAQAETTLQSDIELARKQLVMGQQALATVKSRADVMREHTQLIKKAFTQGERGLAELLRSEALSHEAEVAVHQQQIAVGLGRARLNQALGVVP